MLARDLARAGQLAQAQATCVSLDAGTWRDECHFLLADAQADTPLQVRELCGQAGRFRNQCVGHAIARAITGIIHDSRPGTELQTMAALDAAIEPYIPGPGRAMRVEALMAKEIAGRTQDSHFSVETCGQAPAIVCQKAYAERMRSAVRASGRQDGAWRAACPPPVDQERAATLQLPTWDDALDEVISGGWLQLCR